MCIVKLTVGTTAHLQCVYTHRRYYSPWAEAFFSRLGVLNEDEEHCLHEQVACRNTNILTPFSSPLLRHDDL